jgi:YVTN family beta-propeller protein
MVWTGSIVIGAPAPPSGPLNGPNVAFYPSGSTYYVTDPTTNSVYVVKNSGIIAGPLAVGNNPGPIVINPVSPYTLFVGNTADSTFNTINPATNAIAGPHALAEPPYGLTTFFIGPSVHYYAFVAMNVAGHSALIAEATPFGVTAKTVGAPGVGAAWVGSNLHTGVELFVTDFTDGEVFVLTVAPGSYPPTLTAAATVTGFSSPWGAVSGDPAGIYSVYVANSGSNTVSVVSLVTNAVTATITVGNAPMGIAIVQVGATWCLYVANYTDGTVSVINAATNAVIATIAVGHGPVGVTAGSTGGSPEIAVCNATDRTVTFINPATNTVTATVSL